MYEKWQRLLKLFELDNPLRLISKDILGARFKTEQGSTFLATITDRYTELAKVIPTSSKTANSVSHIVFDHSATNFAISSNLMTENSLQFYFKPFAFVYSTLGVNNPRPQTTIYIQFVTPIFSTRQ